MAGVSSVHRPHAVSRSHVSPTCSRLGAGSPHTTIAVSPPNAKNVRPSGLSAPPVSARARGVGPEGPFGSSHTGFAQLEDEPVPPEPPAPLDDELALEVLPVDWVSSPPQAEAARTQRVIKEAGRIVRPSMTASIDQPRSVFQRDLRLAARGHEPQAPAATTLLLDR